MAKTLNVSIVITVWNEEKTLDSLFKSLFAQTRKPNEIVVVDGGSSDKTVEIIKNYQKRLKSIKLFVSPGSIAHGRNFGIKKAKYEVIAMIDAGCVADKHWLERIIMPFEKNNADFVGGFYHIVGDSPLQKAVAPYHGVPPKRFDYKTFLPSARSIAFRKSVWTKVGGFNEQLERAGEDTLFNYQAIKNGFTINKVKDAVVYWTAPVTLYESIKKFYVYAKGDAQASIWWHPGKRLATHNIKISSIFFRYFLLAIIFLISFKFGIVMFVFYMFLSIIKSLDVVWEWKARLLLPIIQLVSDIAVMSGFLLGSIRKGGLL